MRLLDFDYALPEDRVARHPAARRDHSRLLHVPASGGLGHHRFLDLPGLLQDGDLLVVNDSAVLPARLEARKASSGGRVEVLLIEPLDDPNRWSALLGASKRPRAGTELVLAGGERLEVESSLGDGRYALLLPEPAEALCARHGSPPLPPYLGRAAGPEDILRYETVYADPNRRGSVAAPTAGLHFTPELLDALSRRGVERASLTLYVGPGTFLPIRGHDIEQHRMHRERFDLPEETVHRITEARREGRRVVAVGTTTTRVLESFAGELSAGPGSTELFIRPGHSFRWIDALITNFHLPRSTLLVLVCAFAGRDRVLSAYREAVESGYRFFSYGDATLLEAAR